MRRALSIVSAFTLAVAVLGACSSSGSSGSAADATKVNLTAKNFAYTPTEVSVKAGKITFVVDNTGSVEHNLTVPGLKVDKDVEDGETASVTVDAKAGTYAFHCEYHPTQMKGTITVG